jgi:hypothetical protein
MTRGMAGTGGERFVLRFKDGSGAIGENSELSVLLRQAKSLGDKVEIWDRTEMRLRDKMEYYRQ